MLFKEAVEPFFIHSKVKRNHAKEAQIKIRDCFCAPFVESVEVIFLWVPQVRRRQ